MTKNHTMIEQLIVIGHVLLLCILLCGGSMQLLWLSKETLLEERRVDVRIEGGLNLMVLKF